MTDLIRRSDALAACQGMDPEGDINNLPAVTVGLPTDCRKWPFYPIQMPTTKDGKGPATIGVDAASVSYEVWDWEFNTYASFEHLPDAINEAMRLSLAALEPVASPDPVHRPTMTDMIVDPDTLDAFMEANPLPPDPACDHCGMDPAAIREAALMERAVILCQQEADRGHKNGQFGYHLGAVACRNAILALIAKGAAE